MNLVFVRPDNIGDLILTLPAASILKQQLPHVRLTYLVSRYAAPVLDNHPDVDEILCDPGPDPVNERRTILNRDFDAVVFFKPYLAWFWAAYRAGIRRRVGTGYRWYSFLLSDRVYEHRSRFDKHESEYNIGLLQPLGIHGAPPKPPRLYLTPLETKQAEELLAKLPHPRVIVHPGNTYARNWKPERYFDLVKELEALRISLILTGNEQERTAFTSSEQAAYLSTSRVLNLMGNLSLRQLIAVISQCDLVISGSTGPMHIATTFDVATVSLFDPRRGSSPVRWGPLGEQGVVLKPEVPTCEKCIYEKCPYWDCMDRIPVGEVVQKVQETLSSDL